MTTITSHDYVITLNEFIRIYPNNRGEREREKETNSNTERERERERES